MGTWPARANGVATIRQKLPDQSGFDRFSKRGLANWLVWFACAGTLSISIASCSKPAEPPPFVAIEHEISPQPIRVGPVTVILRLADATGKSLAQAHIAIEADMSHPGMSPLFAEATETEPGRYEAHLQFQMAGDWVLLLHITLPSGKKLERQIDVKGVRPGVRTN
jgi:YtkA-like protein